MPQFFVDDEVAALVEKLAKPKPFENLSFNAALKRVVAGLVKGPKPEFDGDALLEEMLAMKVPKKAPSPSAEQWVASVPELAAKKGLVNWKTICDFLKIDPSGDSARRKLQKWVKDNKPSWPEVPGA